LARRGCSARRPAGNLEDPGAELTQHCGELPALVIIAHPGRVTAILRRRRKPKRAGMHRLADQLFHSSHLTGSRPYAYHRRLAHHIARNSRMADQAADIDAAFLGQRVQVISDRLPGYVDTRLQDGKRNLLGVRKEFEIPLAVSGPRGGDDLAALADDDRRMSVLHRRATIGIPDRLRIEMSVMIDEPRSDDAPLGVDDALGRSAFVLSDADDFPLMHAAMGLEALLARAVPAAAVPDEQIISHNFSSSLPRPVRAWAIAAGRSHRAGGPPAPSLMVHDGAYASPRAPAILSLDCGEGGCR